MSASKAAITIIIACLILTGCSQQSKEDYSQAGQSLKQAAKDTGQALKTDAKVVGKATDKAVHDVKASADKNKEKASHK